MSDSDTIMEDVEMAESEQSGAVTSIVPALNFDVLDMIYDHAIERIVVSQPHLVPTIFRSMEPNDIMLVSRQAADVIRRTHRLRYWLDTPPHYHVRVDPYNDIILTAFHSLPRMVPTRVWPLPGMNPQALPVRRVAAYFHSLQPDEADPWSFSRVPPNIRRMEMGRTVLKLDNLPLLREFFVSVTNSNVDWWLEGYQQHHPEIIGNRISRCTWHRAENNDYMSSGKYFRERGLVADTGIRWNRPHWRTVRNNMAEMRANAEGRSPAFDIIRWPSSFLEHRRYRPNIGFMGYSMGSSSCGGQWAGFRYFVATCRVEFSPLSYDEVKDVMNAHEDYSPYEESKLHPEMILKLFIVHPGDTPPSEPHHCWEEVQGPYPGEEDGDTTQAIRCLWYRLRGILNYPRSQAGHMKLEPLPNE